MFAESATGIVKNVVLDDRGGSSQVDDAERQVVEGDKTCGTCLLHLLTNECEIGLEIEFVRTYEHRVTTGSLLTLGVNILASKGLRETIGVDATDFFHVVDEGEAVGIVQVDEHVLTMTALQIAEGGIVAEGRDVLHVAEQLLILACYGERVEWVLRTTEGGMAQGDSAEGARLTRCRLVVEGLTMTEIPVKGGNEQRTLWADGVEDRLKKLVAIETFTIADGGEGELHDI